MMDIIWIVRFDLSACPFSLRYSFLLVNGIMELVLSLLLLDLPSELAIVAAS